MRAIRDLSFATVGLIVTACFPGPVAFAGAVLYGASVGDEILILLEDDKTMPKKLIIPLFGVTPEEIFANHIPFLDANIINPKETFDRTGKLVDENGEEIKVDVPVVSLRSTISSWYISLRNLAIVILMIVLLYIGIRIIISSTASNKAKYQQYLKDWIIGMLLLFFMHYIMSFSFTLVDEITKLLDSSVKYPVMQLNLSKNVKLSMKS